MIPIIIRGCCLILILSIFPFSLIIGQEAQAISDEWTETIAEEIVHGPKTDVDLTELLAHLQDLRENPLNLNHAKQRSWKNFICSMNSR